ncbi:MAG: hypothetical protein NUV72_04045, partial [Bauldia sp.]|nr:hypothetical protein [Bauldia sp.]
PRFSATVFPPPRGLRIEALANVSRGYRIVGAVIRGGRLGVSRVSLKENASTGFGLKLIIVSPLSIL